MKPRILLVIISVAILLSALSGCSDIWELGENPPDYDAIKKIYEEHQNDMDMIVAYIQNAEYEWVHFDEPNGTMSADFQKNIPITDPKLASVVKKLLDHGAVQEIYSNKGHVVFCCWSSVKEKSCGIAYSFDHTKTPDVQYATELIAFSEPGWFYYVEDYNEYRTGKRPDQ